MKKFVLILSAIICFNALSAQSTQFCTCIFENDNDALSALVEKQNHFIIDSYKQDPITATTALIACGLEVYQALPNASYVIKVTSGGETRYSSVSSCQMALEKTYDLLLKNVDEVRIISEYPTLHGSCRNRTYTPNDLQDVKNRRDGNFGGRY